MSEVIELLTELVAIDSVNPGLVPNAAGEGAIVSHLRDRLAAAGFETRVVEAAESGRPSLLAWTPAPARHTVLLNGHLDTVGVEGMADPFTAGIDGDRLTGRGSCDMKGGCAALVVAAERLARANSPETPRIVLALVADEEDRSLGTEAVLAALPALGLRPEVAVVAEPTWLGLATQHRGYAVAEVTFAGRAAHSSQPAEGINAVTHLGHLLAAVTAAAPEIEARGGSLMVTVVNGGSAPFSIPARARAVVERRTVPGEQAGDLVTELQSILDDLRTTHPDLTATVELTHSREAWQLASTGPSAALAATLTEHLSALGQANTDFAAPYWMESALFEEAGIPTVVCGPAGGGLHAIDEWVSIAQVEAFTDALVEVLPRWAADAD